MRSLYQNITGSLFVSRRSCPRALLFGQNAIATPIFADPLFPLEEVEWALGDTYLLWYGHQYLDIFTEETSSYGSNT